MADDIDRAQDREQTDRDLALKAQAARIAASFEPIDPAQAGFCIDCEQPIEAARLQALRGATVRCSACARDFEARMTREQGGRRAYA